MGSKNTFPPYEKVSKNQITMNEPSNDSLISYSSSDQYLKEMSFSNVKSKVNNSNSHDIGEDDDISIVFSDTSSISFDFDDNNIIFNDEEDKHDDSKLSSVCSLCYSDDED